MPSEISVTITGVKDLREGLTRVDRSLRSHLLRSTAKIADEAEKSAESHASDQGFDPPGRSGRGTGALMREIKASPRGYTVFLRDTAHRIGKTTPFAYPAVYEYGKKQRRPFLRPAAADMEKLAVAEVERAVIESANAM